MKKFLAKAVSFFIPIKKYRTKFKKKMQNWLGGEAASKTHENAKGNVLVSYMKDSLLLEDGDKNLMYHTNRWENREIARIFYDLGYNVDCIDFNVNFYPKKKYDIIFDISDNIIKLENFLKPGALKIQHLTGSYWKYNNSQALERNQRLEKRRGLKIEIERLAVDNDNVMRVADVCTLVGNEHTLKTYPVELREKIHLVNLTGSELSKVKKSGEYYPPEKEFLWMGGAGPVHKGLDILLEIFSKHPEWTLNVMGKISLKSDFAKLYKKEMTELPNIKFHGLVMPSSEKFNEVIEKCFAYVNPSCSEATSTASVTALSVGLYPIVSYDNGLTLPSSYRIYLDKCEINEVEMALEKVWNLPKQRVEEEIEKVQRMILENFSRDNFSQSMREYIGQQINMMYKR